MTITEYYDMSSDSETKNEAGDEKTIKKKGGSKKRALWRYNDDGTYNWKPLDPNYNRKYYEEHGKAKWTCPLCNRTVCSIYARARHQRSNLCKKNRELIPV